MSPQEFEQALHDAEVKLARLKALYEQWFQGIEKLEPGVARKDLERTFEVLKKNMPRNTALRFRTQQLWARYGTYGIYWTRIARRIEEGTFRREYSRATKKRPERDKAPAEQGWELDVDVEEVEELEDDKTDPGIVVTNDTSSPPKVQSPSPQRGPAFDEGDLDAILGALTPTTTEDSVAKARTPRPISPFAISSARPAAGGASATFGKPRDKPVAAAAAPAPIAPRPVAAAIPKPAPVAIPKPAPAPTPAPAARNGDLDDQQMRAIYSRYVDARRQNNERTDVRYESLAESVQKMMPKLREKHAGKPIDFEIVLQNGKVGLKPKVGG